MSGQALDLESRELGLSTQIMGDGGFCPSLAGNKAGNALLQLQVTGIYSLHWAAGPASTSETSQPPTSRAPASGSTLKGPEMSKSRILPSASPWEPELQGSLGCDELALYQIEGVSMEVHHNSSCAGSAADS